MNNGGDVLARGARSAQFAAGGSEKSDFEYDMMLRRDVVAEKYGLSPSEIVEYEVRINDGERFNLPLASEKEQLGKGIMVIDRRPNWARAEAEVKPVPEAPRKYPEKRYAVGSPILDRVLIKRCAESADMQIMSDGSVLNKKTGLVIAAKYRQHSNVGI